MIPSVVEKLQSGRASVRIVCFGDSITGVYFHTGGQRAWCDMLGIALQRIYPRAKIEMFNAGLSGNSTIEGLARMEKDVSVHQPHLVVVMFGMNDCKYGGKPEEFGENLEKIVQRSREIGAEVILCTPNSIYPQDQLRVPYLAGFAEIVRKTAARMAVPLVDCYRVYEDLRAVSPTEWMLLMSETVHPAMHGHKLFAEVIAETITDRRISLVDVPPFSPSLDFTLRRIRQKQPVSMIAMPPYDKIMADALCNCFPDARIDVTTWSVAGVSLKAIEAWAKDVRDKKPNLVVIAVPSEAKAATEEEFIRSYNEMLNWSLAPGNPEWDVVVIVPAGEDLARRVILGKDIGYIELPKGDISASGAVVARWVQEQDKDE